MMQPVFITGIGTDVGKTVVAAIVTAALNADYWKPVQAGFDEGTDGGFISKVLRETPAVIHPEAYKLALPASPHLSARAENIRIDLDLICNQLRVIQTDKQYLVIEGAGGLMVPLNDDEFVIDLIKKMHAKVLLISRNYLGSINHSLLTAAACKAHQLDVAGWIFNDHYMDYEDEIIRWSGYPKIASIPFDQTKDPAFILSNAAKIKNALSLVL